MRKAAILLTLSAGLLLAEAPKADISFAEYHRFAQNLQIPCEAGVAYSDAFEFPAVPQKEGMTIVLKLNQRILAKTEDGWNRYCGIELNGRDVGPETDRNLPRLLLRGPVMHTNHPREKEVPYWQVAAHPFLLSFFAPKDSGQLDSRIIDRQYGYDYYLVIDDLVNKLVVGADDRVERDTPNRVRFLNGLFKNILDTSLYIGEATIGYVPASEIIALSGVALKTFHPIAEPAAVVRGDGFKLNVGKNGGMELAVGEGRVYFESLFSYPKEPVMLFNRFGVDCLDGEAEASVSVGRDGTMTYRTKCLEIRRSIRSCGHYLRFVDRIANVSNEDVGVVWKNQASFSGVMPAVWRIAGMTASNTSNAFAAMNPTIYLSDGGNCAVGIVAEDTLSRNLIDMRTEGNALSMGCKGAGIQAGRSLALEWTVYPLVSPNMGYFDFINRVREDWGVNTTIPGPFHFFMGDTPGLRLQFGFLNKWLHYYDGWKLTDEQFIELMKAMAAPLRERFPGIKLLGKVETNLVPMKVTDYDWCVQLPMTRGDRKNPLTKYAQYLPPQLSRKLADATPYRDSLLWNDHGGVMIDNYYTVDNYDTINLMVQVQTGNQRYRKFMEQIDLLMDSAGLDGVYIDQFNPGPADGLDYSKWDGVSIGLDRAGRIVSRYYNYSIMGAEGRRQIIRRIIEKGGIAFTNGHPVTREEQNSGRLSFVEMENDGNSVNPIGYLTAKPPETSWTVSGHLASPITLNLRPSRFTPTLPKGSPDLRAQFLTKGFILALRNATIPYYYTSKIPLEGPTAGSFEIGNWLLPFTPVQLGEGVMVGKERTIVCVSGRYTVKGAKRPDIAKFNCYGRPVEEPFEITGGPGAWTVAVKLDDWNEVAVILVKE